MIKPCVRCGGHPDRHPSGTPYCLHYVEPAPLWMRVLNVVTRAMGGRR